MSITLHESVTLCGSINGKPDFSNLKGKRYGDRRIVIDDPKLNSMLTFNKEDILLATGITSIRFDVTVYENKPDGEPPHDGGGYPIYRDNVKVGDVVPLFPLVDQGRKERATLHWRCIILKGWPKEIYVWSLNYDDVDRKLLVEPRKRLPV